MDVMPPNLDLTMSLAFCCPCFCIPHGPSLSPTSRLSVGLPGIARIPSPGTQVWVTYLALPHLFHALQCTGIEPLLLHKVGERLACGYIRPVK